MTLPQTSLIKLRNVHPDLVRVIELAAKGLVPFVVTEGLRTMARQRKLVAAGASQTLRSKHLTGRAVDLACTVGGKVRWDWPLYDKLAHEIKKAAHTLNVPVEWGGDWQSFKDGPHFQLKDGWNEQHQT